MEADGPLRLPQPAEGGPPPTPDEFRPPPNQVAEDGSCAHHSYEPLSWDFVRGPYSAVKYPFCLSTKDWGEVNIFL